MTQPVFSSKLTQRLLQLSRRRKQAVVIAGDVVAAWLAMWLAFTLRLETWHVPAIQQLWIYAAAPAIFLPIFIRLGLYRAIFRYTGLATMQTLFKGAALYGGILLGLVLLTFPIGIPRSVGVLQPILFLVLVSNSRAWGRFWLNKGVRREAKQRLLIYGAGSAGAQTAAAVTSGGEFELLGFIDDDATKVGRHINGVPVYGPADAAAAVERLGVTDILLAVPSATRHRRLAIIEALRTTPVHIRTLPGIADLAAGRVAISDFRELDLEDLLGREPVPPNPTLLARDLAAKCVMVTGAGGSIGSELCRQIIRESPDKLLLIEHSEFALYAIHSELSEAVRRTGERVELVPLLGSVRDFDRMLGICKSFKPHTVYHAAAYKHVPLVEYNSCEGLANNTFGTLNMARAAMQSAAASFVLVSTDKAVRPTNVMGASKRIAEMILQALAEEQMVRFDDEPAIAGLMRNRTRFSMVRFGNVLGSSGSVVPLFRKQIRAGGPITLTHAEVTRYFMTIPEATQLVLQAGAMAEGGEVFVLDMGEPVKIIDLARRVVQLSGFTVRDQDSPEGDIEIKVTGLRPGEKLYEELLIGSNPSATAHPRIMMAKEDFVPWDTLRPALATLRLAVEAGNGVDARRQLIPLVSGYQDAPEPAEWHVAQNSVAL